MIVLPIGERWALIAVLTAFTTPRVTFWVLLVSAAPSPPRTPRPGGSCAPCAAPRRTGRAPPARPGPWPTSPTVDRSRTRAPLPGARRRGGRRPRHGAGDGLRPRVGRRMADRPGRPRLRDLLRRSRRPPPHRPPRLARPPLFRAAEYGTVLVLAADAEVNGALPAAYGLVSAVAYHHYDTVYRIRGDAGAPPRALVRAIGGTKVARSRSPSWRPCSPRPDSPSRSRPSPWPWLSWCSPRASASGSPPTRVAHPPYTTKENPHDRPRAGGLRLLWLSAPLHRHPAQGAGAGGARGHRRGTDGPGPDARQLRGDRADRGGCRGRLPQGGRVRAQGGAGGQVRAEADAHRQRQGGGVEQRLLAVVRAGRPEGRGDPRQRRHGAPGVGGADAAGRAR